MKRGMSFSRCGNPGNPACGSGGIVPKTHCLTFGVWGKGEVREWSRPQVIYFAVTVCPNRATPYVIPPKGIV